MISAAFAVGARRQLHTLGLLAANGAPPSVVRGAVVWQGVWVGAIGSLVGLGLGAVGLALVWPASRSVPNGPGHWVWSPLDLVPIVVIGIAASTAAAYLPARSASAVSVLHALAGRRPERPTGVRAVRNGMIAAVIGLASLATAVAGQEVTPRSESAWVVLAVVGGLAVLGGAVAATPFLVGATGSAARWFGGTARLALRSVGRQRSRYGAVVAGIAAAATLCLATSAAVRSSQVQAEAREPIPAHDATVIVDAVGVTRADQQLVAPDGTTTLTGPGPPPLGQGDAVTAAQLDAIETVLPGARRVTTPRVDARDADFGSSGEAVERYFTNGAPSAAPASPALLDALDVPDEVRAAIDRGEVAAIGAPAEVRSVRLVGGMENTYPVEDPETEPFPAVEVTPFPDLPTAYGLPSVLLPMDVAERIGLADAPAGDTAIIFRSPQALTANQRAAIDELVAGDDRFRLAGTPPPASDDVDLSVTMGGAGPRPDSSAVTLAWSAGITLGFSALVVALGLALAARDTRDERDVLEAIGAPPKLLRRLAGARAASAGRARCRHRRADRPGARVGRQPGLEAGGPLRGPVVLGAGRPGGDPVGHRRRRTRRRRRHVPMAAGDGVEVPAD